MKLSSKQVISSLTIAFISLLLILTVCEGLVIYKTFGTANPITVYERLSKAEAAESGNNPNDCLFGGCGNFY